MYAVPHPSSMTSRPATIREGAKLGFWRLKIPHVGVSVSHARGPLGVLCRPGIPHNSVLLNMLREILADRFLPATNLDRRILELQTDEAHQA